MKKSIQIIATVFSILLGNVGFSQNDTIYFMKDGVIVHKQPVNPSDVDSAIFYNPNPIDTTTNSTITDVDGNVYTSVTIGTQEWMSENLRTSKYSDGTPIPNITDNTEWVYLNTGAWCNYDNDSSKYEAMYGKLYNWYAVETGKLCPTGWHVPTDAEWTELTDYLVGQITVIAEGTALKSILGWYWDGNGTDDYGWNGLPGGKRSYDGSDYKGEYGIWWSSSKAMTGTAWTRFLYFNDDNVTRSLEYNTNGYSVRCLRD